LAAETSTACLHDALPIYTSSVDYFGDSIANSAGDVIACMVGFWIASKLGPKRSLIFFLGVELILLLWIRDGLLLNILQLIYPVEDRKSTRLNSSHVKISY